MNFILFISLIILSSCENKRIHTIESSTEKLDSLKSVISALEREIKWLKQDNPFVRVLYTEASTCAILHFKPVGLTIKLNNVRPDYNKRTFLCVPAAFTSLKQAVDGCFMKEGRLINETINNDINGFMMFNEQECDIDSIKYLTANRLKIAKEGNYNIFQQFLLVKKSKLVKCEKFQNRENMRRAIVKYSEGDIFIVESHRPMTILEFQEALVEIGVEDALYLDMGTFSEGWYKSNDHEKIKIGELFSSTNKQTNWLTFERKEK